MKSGGGEKAEGRQPSEFWVLQLDNVLNQGTDSRRKKKNDSN